MGLLLRSLLWTVAMPGMIAGYIPCRFFGLRESTFDASNARQWIALTLIALGVLLLAACIVEFARRGRGTLSPVDPPRELVVHGLYRYVRNPMYVAVTMILLGEALWLGSRDVVIYWAVFFTAANVFIVVYEEPHLRRQFGDSYADYTRRVGRWMPRLR